MRQSYAAIADPAVSLCPSQVSTSISGLNREPLLSSRNPALRRIKLPAAGLFTLMQGFIHWMRCGVTISINSRDVITFVFFQNFGKCRRLPVTR
jgi:hypothetical protein